MQEYCNIEIIFNITQMFFTIPNSVKPLLVGVTCFMFNNMTLIVSLLFINRLDMAKLKSTLRNDIRLKLTQLHYKYDTMFGSSR